MIKKAATAIKKENERAARHNIMEELFYDFHQSRKEVYWVNFIRGIFFGVGSLIGGTLVLALIITILNLLVDVPGGIGDFVEYIISIVENR